MEFKEMLVLHRKNHDSILIGNNVKITFKEIKSGRCKVVIDAPKEIKILRSELKVENGKAVK